MNSGDRAPVPRPRESKSHGKMKLIKREDVERKRHEKRKRARWRWSVPGYVLRQERIEEQRRLEAAQAPTLPPISKAWGEVKEIRDPCKPSHSWPILGHYWDKTKP
jgi:hypothetical protein